MSNTRSLRGIVFEKIYKYDKPSHMRQSPTSRHTIFMHHAFLRPLTEMPGDNSEGDVE